MQAFEWQEYYSAIMMVWCAGYLTHSELVAFLRQAKARLLVVEGRVTRHRPPESYIFVFDNLRSEEYAQFECKGQTVRSQKELEDIFSEAGLLIFKKEGPDYMPAPYGQAMAWALY